jgi:cell division protein FtsB
MKMKLEHFSIDRLAAVPKQVEWGTAVGGRGRRHARLQSRQRKELKQLQTENTRLKKLVTELRLDKSILENVARLCSANKLSS